MVIEVALGYFNKCFCDDGKRAGNWDASAAPRVAPRLPLGCSGLELEWLICRFDKISTALLAEAVFEVKFASPFFSLITVNAPGCPLFIVLIQLYGSYLCLPLRLGVVGNLAARHERRDARASWRGHGRFHRSSCSWLQL